MPSVEDLRRTFGRHLQALRSALKLSQEEVSHRARLHATYLSDLERGTQTPTLDVINRLSRALGVTLATLFAPFDRPFRQRVRKTRSDVGTSRYPPRGKKARKAD